MVLPPQIEVVKRREAYGLLGKNLISVGERWGFYKREAKKIWWAQNPETRLEECAVHIKTFQKELIVNRTQSGHRYYLFFARSPEKLMLPLEAAPDPNTYRGREVVEIYSDLHRLWRRKISLYFVLPYYNLSHIQISQKEVQWFLQAWGDLLRTPILEPSRWDHRACSFHNKSIECR